VVSFFNFLCFLKQEKKIFSFSYFEGGAEVIMLSRTMPVCIIKYTDNIKTNKTKSGADLGFQKGGC